MNFGSQCLQVCSLRLHTPAQVFSALLLEMAATFQMLCTTKTELDYGTVIHLIAKRNVLISVPRIGLGTGD